MVAEIKGVAGRQLAEVGPAALSLRAVSREMGMVSSALYRYFRSRDDLLTALIVDAYDALGETAEEADARRKRDDVTGRWHAVCAAIRGWALEHPNEYALVYGSPVPGYRAPADTIGPATRIPRVLGAILADAHTRGAAAVVSASIPAAVRVDVRRLRREVLPDVPEPLLARGLVAWASLFGLISFELFGHFHNVVHDGDAFFDHATRLLAELAGL